MDGATQNEYVADEICTTAPGGDDDRLVAVAMRDGATCTGHLGPVRSQEGSEGIRRRLDRTGDHRDAVELSVTWDDTATPTAVAECPGRAVRIPVTDLGWEYGTCPAQCGPLFAWQSEYRCPSCGAVYTIDAITSAARLRREPDGADGTDASPSDRPTARRV